MAHGYATRVLQLVKDESQLLAASEEAYQAAVAFVEHRRRMGGVNTILRTGRELTADDIDLCARALSMGRPHHAYPGTSAVATGVAAALPGSVVHDLATGSPAARRIGHAAGVMSVGAELDCRDGVWTAPAVSLQRSARCLMAGDVFIPVG